VTGMTAIDGIPVMRGRPAVNGIVGLRAMA